MGIGDLPPSLNAMDKVILFVIVIAIVVVAVKLRSDAAKSRKATVQRISQEYEARDSLSPTADLFRETGVPVPDALAPSTPAAAEPATATALPSADLATVFTGIHLPVSLTPVDAGDPHHMTLQSPADPVTVRRALDDELHELGAAVTWDEAGHGEIHNNGGRVAVRVEGTSDPDAPTGVTSRVYLESI